SPQCFVEVSIGRRLAGGCLAKPRQRRRARPARFGPKKFAEPVSLSSTLPTDLRLPPTAARLGFDLLALRARRKQHSRGLKGSVQGRKKRKARNLRRLNYSHLPQSIVQHVENRPWPGHPEDR